MALTVGVVGKPNAGKSTFFSALTMADAKIAAFPFTTLEPNVGVGYVRKNCPHLERFPECNPKDSFCRQGTRFVPLKMIDVAGLVPEAHKGKGLGFQFLDDLSAADALIHVIDGSGKTDLEGKPATSHDPASEINFLREELFHWIATILKRNWKKVRTRDISALSDILTGLKITPSQTEACARRLSLETKRIDWTEEERLAFSKELLETKPIIVAANKCDEGCSITKLNEQFPSLAIVPCSALYELTLKRADKAGAISYVPGNESFKIKNVSGRQKGALEKIANYLGENGSTGVQQALETLVYKMMGNLVAFPVEDESKWSDRKGNILPNSFLLPEGSTPVDLAEKVHTDLADKFISALDARKKTRLSKEYQLKDCDIIKIFSK
ncbi:redox-regulated ATPase YchF [Candidatus Micrarchaeota archaeon]|nr:redox-regulated ATPase YchF [Candidatus Micrarchaeota archaeon]MBD3417929.1 redox-regulated ATPase YchF [Candidatus Micrarchaeota archaeon]